MLRKSHCRLGSSPEAENTQDSPRGPPWPQHKNLGTSPAFAIGLMAGDGRPKGTRMNSGTVGSAFPHSRYGALYALFHPLHQFTVGQHQSLLHLDLGYDGLLSLD